MMRDYIENLLRNKVSPNSGYVYIATEDIAIPVHKVTLGISKRKIINLELVEEMILRLVSAGINDIDTIADILGLPRDILDISVGDLHLKDLAYHSSGKCILTTKGIESLKNLSISKREKDIIRNVYVDAVTGEITGEKNQDYTERRIHDSTKLKHEIDASSIVLYRRNMGVINTIFEQSIKTYLDDNMTIQDELVSIDSIDDMTTGFIVTPIHIYVSEGGVDIDVSARNMRHKNIVDSHKSAVIEQMRTRKLLANLFANSARSNKPPTTVNDSNDDFIQTLRALLSIESDDDFENKARNTLFTSRRLLENEMLDFCKLAFINASSIEILIDELNYWSKNIKFKSICSFITKKIKCRILYNDVNGPTERSIKRIDEACPNIHRENIIKSNHTACMQINIDSRLQIVVFLEFVKVFKENLYMPRTIVYVSDKKREFRN